MPYHCLGPADQIPAGAGKEFQVDDRVIAVFHTRDDRWFAAQGLCPHAGGHLAEGALGSSRVICPDHQWKFDLETGLCVGGEEARLKTYAVEVREDMIHVEIDLLCRRTVNTLTDEDDEDDDEDEETATP